MKDLNVDLESFSKEEFEEEELGDEEEENVLAGGCLDNCCNHISCLLICIEELIVSFLIAIWWFNLIYIFRYYCVICHLFIRNSLFCLLH